jgi:hypothetical protein
MTRSRYRNDMKDQIITTSDQALPALQQPTTTLAAFSIGPACDLAKLDNEFRAWVRTPWRSDEIVTPTADA